MERRHWHEADEEAVEEIANALPIVLAGGERIDATDADTVFANVAARLTPLEAEGLGGALRSVGRWAGDKKLRSFAGAALPLAATTLGAAYGGPVGASLGGAVGGSLGSLIAGGKASSDTTSRPLAGATPGGTPLSDPASTAAPTGAAQNGSSAAAKLLYLVQNPAFAASLASLAVGSKGARELKVGNTQVPVSGILNAATALLEKATEDAEELAGDAMDAADAYLRDGAGRLVVDPAVPSRRAEALLALLQRHELESVDFDGGL